jgi:hypothetical protein
MKAASHTKTFLSMTLKQTVATKLTQQVQVLQRLTGTKLVKKFPNYSKTQNSIPLFNLNPTLEIINLAHV